MKITKSFTKADISKEKIIIYGAGRYGELALRGLQAMGVEPFAFVDQVFAKKRYLGVPVLSPGELSNYSDAMVLIASYNYFYEMLAFLQSIGHEKIYDILALIKLDYDTSVLSEYALDEKNNYAKYQGVIDYADSDGLVITHCELVITECCTLKCRDCANLMQYYKCPENLNIDEIIMDFNKFLDSIDMLLELRLLGGEPFICKKLDEIINTFVDNEKIKRITIYTNSTLIPSDKVLNAMINSKVSVHMSDYGKVSCKKQQLDNILTQKNINHYIHVYENWYDLGGTEKRNYSEVKLRDLYRNCLMAKCYTFYRGKLYTCPRAAHGEQQGRFHNCKEEFIDFGKNMDIDTKREEIKRLTKYTEYIMACDYCNGSSVRSKQVEAAVQTKFI